MRVALVLLCIGACLVCAGAARARPKPRFQPRAPKLQYGPWPSGELDLQIDTEEPLTWCDVVLSRDGAIVRHGKPEHGADAMVFDRLAAGDYDVRVVARSLAPRGRPDAPDLGRRTMWVRNGSVDGRGEVKVGRKAKPCVLKLRVRWGQRVAGAIVAD
jgi:hypothetical protein